MPVQTSRTSAPLIPLLIYSNFRVLDDHRTFKSLPTGVRIMKAQSIEFKTLLRGIDHGDRKARVSSSKKTRF